MQLRPLPRRLSPFLRVPPKPGYRSLQYQISYVAARCQVSYQALKRPGRTFYFGIVAASPRHRIG